MKKNIFVLLFAVLVILYGCDSLEETPEQKISDYRQEYAYFEVFKKYSDDNLTYDAKYLAIDLSKVKLEDTSNLVTLFQDYCEENDYIFLQGTIESLTEKGYITENFPTYFEEGFVIQFIDEKIEENKLVTHGIIWRSGLAARGADYTVEKIDGVWEITKTGGGWIS